MNALAQTFVVDDRPRCKGTRPHGEHKGELCRKVLAVRVSRPWTLVCPRCKHTNRGP